MCCFECFCDYGRGDISEASDIFHVKPILKIYMIQEPVRLGMWHTWLREWRLVGSWWGKVKGLDSFEGPGMYICWRVVEMDIKEAFFHGQQAYIDIMLISHVNKITYFNNLCSS